MVIPRTLCFIVNGGDVLLMKRAPHKRAFPGRYNGIGGHIERGENPLASARREIQEETGLTPDQLLDLRLRGVSNIDAGQEAGIMLFIFSARSTVRTVPAQSDEGSLHWIALNTLLDPANGLPLVEDLPILLPRLFGAAASDSPFFAHVGYDLDDRMIVAFA